MYTKYVKRLFDLSISIIALPFFLIVFIVVAPMIIVADKGPVFYNAERIGYKGKIYKMYKFRSMRVNAPDIRNEDGSTFNSENDPRVTNIGRILRKTSIDEIPQVINVLKGDMSIIGPRPTIPFEGFNYEAIDDYQKKHYLVRPGITGYSQAYFRNSISQDEKFKNDAYYVENVSLLLDIKIFLKTIAAVVNKKNIYTK